MPRIKEVAGDETTEAADLYAQIEAANKRREAIWQELEESKAETKRLNKEHEEAQDEVNRLAGARSEQRPLLDAEDEE